jgi:hypothetical protein
MSTSRRMRRRWAIAVLLAVPAAAVAAVAVLLAPLFGAAGRVAEAEERLAAATGWHARLDDLQVGWAAGPVLSGSGLVLEDLAGTVRIVAPRVEIRPDRRALLRGRVVARRALLLRAQIRVRPGFRWPEGAGTLEELEVRGAELDLEWSAGRRMRLEQVAAVLTPPTGRLWGNGRLPAGGGRVRWLGLRGEPVTIDVEEIRTAALAALGAPAPFPPGASVSGRLVRAPEGALTAALAVRNLRLREEAPPLPPLEVTAALAPTGGGWRAEDLAVAGAGVALRGSGRVWPEPRVELVFDERPLEELAALAQQAGAAGPAVEAPRARAVGRVELALDGSGRLAITAEGRVRAPRLRWARGLPALEEVTGRWTLGPEGPGPVELDGRLAGGRADLRLRPRPEGFELAGRLAGARLARLLPAPGRAGDAGVDLAGSLTIADGRVVAGGLAVELEGIELPGWRPPPVPGEDGRAWELVGGHGRLARDAGRWRLEALELAGPGLRLRGAGELEPARGTLRLVLETAEAAAPRPATWAGSADRETTWRVEGRWDAPAILAPEDGRMQVERSR